MASIYDIARIASGDPMERVSDRAKEADVLFNQYERQKEIVDEINKAIAEANRKSKKGKLGASLLGSLVGGGLATLTGGMAAGLPKTILSALAAGAGAGAIEKFRQDKSGATDKLKEIERKYKGRKEAKDATEAREAFEAEQKNALKADVLSNILGEVFVPATQKVTETFVDKNIPSKHLDMFPGSVDKITKKSFERGFSPEGEAFLQKLIPGATTKTFESEFFQDPLIAQLARILGPAAFSQLQPEAIVDPLYAPQFRNPYGGF